MRKIYIHRNKNIPEKPVVLPNCLYKDCNKQLNTIEYLYGKYCFKHSAMLNNSIYKAVLFRFNYTTNLWEEQRKISLTIDKYIWAKQCNDNSRFGTNQPFYRYDLINGNAVDVCIYSYNPNLLD